MKIYNIQIVNSFIIDQQITLTVGKMIQQLSKEINAKILNLNTPESAPPNAPRALLRSPDTIVSICYDRFDINLRPPSHIGGDHTSCIKFAKRKIQPIIQTLFVDSLSYQWTGVVVQIEYPYSGPDPTGVIAVKPVAERLINLPINEKELSSFQLQVGFKEESFNRVYFINGYEKRKIDVSFDDDSAIPKVISSDDGTVQEAGFEIKIDINNKPVKGTNTPQEDINTILEDHVSSFAVLADTLNLREIV